MRVQRYLLSELLTAFVLVALIVTGVLFAGFLLQYLHKYSDQLDLFSVLRAAPYFVPLAFPVALPLSFLIACLLTYGRFSDDNEFLATQMGGIHPWHAAAPAVATAAVLAVGIVLLNLDVIPFATLMKKEIARGGFQQLVAAIDDPARKSVTIGGFQMSWEGRDARGLKDVLLTFTAPRDPDEPREERGERQRQVIQATRARVDSSRLAEGQLVLDLDDFQTEVPSEGGTTRVREANRKIALDVETLVGAPPSQSSKGKDEMNASQLYYKARRFRQLAGDDPAARNELKEMRIFETEYWRRVAMGLSPLAFAFVGVGLGLAGGRSSRMAAFLTAILVALPVYYPLVLGGANLARTGVLPAGLALNLGNVVLCAFGLWRFGRVVG